MGVPMPDPASGIAVFFGVNDEFTSSPIGPKWTVTYSNGRSSLVINAETGKPIGDKTHVAAEDTDAFDRIVSPGRHSGWPIPE
jgi:hypothetical protein